MAKTDKDTLRRVHQLRNAASRAFQDKWDQARENARFYRLLQYSDNQLQKIRDEKRVPYVLDYVTPAFNTFLGVQRDERTDCVYLPQGKEDEMRVEVANSVKDSIFRTNGFMHLESDIFQDGNLEKCGTVGYEWSYENNPLGELKMFRVPPKQLSWDLNRRDYDLQLSSWVSRTRLYQKRTLAERFPDMRDEIMKLSVTSNILDSMQLDDSYIRMIIDSELDSVALIEFFEKDYKTKFFIANALSGEVLDMWFNKKKDAEKHIRELLAKYEQQIVPQFAQSGMQPPPPPQYFVKDKRTPIVRKSEVIHSLVLTNEEEIDEPFFPFDSYYPFWHDGEWWGLMDTLKDPQRFINKMYQMIDHQITTGSKGLLLIDDSIPDSEATNLIQLWSTTGGAKRIKDPKNNIHFIPPTGFDPRLLNAMNVAITNLEKKAGGGNFLGHMETASESGIAVEKRIEQGGLSSFVVFDNLSRWKRSVGEHTLWYMSNLMTAAQKIRLEGKDVTEAAQAQFPDWFEPSMRPSMGFLSINTEHQNTLEGLEADVIVDEARHSVTKNQAILQRLSLIMQSSPLIAQTIPPQMVIELLDIPATEKERWIKEAEQLMQSKMQTEQAAAQKPPSITASLGDIEKLDPQAQAQFFAKFFGIQISAPMKTEKPSDEEKLATGIIQQEKDLAFKREKHHDQSMIKLAQLTGQQNLERMKLEKENSHGEETGLQ